MKYLILIIFPSLAYGHPLSDFNFQKALDCIYQNQKKIERHLACKALCDDQQKAGQACHCSVLILNECKQPIKAHRKKKSRR